MRFAVLFTDKPGLGSLRAEHLKAHIDWVSEKRDVVLVAGSLRHQPDDWSKALPDHKALV